MNFHSLTFLLFFIVVYAGYWLLNRAGKGRRNLFLLSGCLFFYGWWDWRFVSLVLLCITSTYLCALLTERSGRKLWTVISVCFNIAILVTFKYFNFFSEQFFRLTSLFFPDVSRPVYDMMLPVGISFYTFQAIGYAVDVYKRRVEAERSYVDFALFVSFFPQLVAGPIERASALLPQFKRRAVWRYDGQVEGLRRILWGLLKKVVIADPCGMMVGRLMPSAATSAVDSTLTVIFFTVQIYCDFSGYCDIAIGTAKCLGVSLSENFKLPYFSTDIQEFWRRWNMSLMTWFRDYIYIPLGGSHKGRLRTSLNVLTVFLLSGLWHGAEMHFVAWGLYWGVLMVVYRLFKRCCGLPVFRSVGMALTILSVMIGWVLFFSRSIAGALAILHMCALPLVALAISACMLGYIVWRLSRVISRRTQMLLRRGFRATAVLLLVAGLFHAPVTIFIARNYLWAFIFILFMLEWRTRQLTSPLQQMPALAWKRFAVYWLMAILVLTGGEADIPFIYFRF